MNISPIIFILISFSLFAFCHDRCLCCLFVLFVCLFVLFVCLFVCVCLLFVCVVCLFVLFVCLFVLFVCVVCLFVCLCCLFVCLFVCCLFVCLFVLFVCLFVCVVCLCCLVVCLVFFWLFIDSRWFSCDFRDFLWTWWFQGWWLTIKQFGLLLCLTWGELLRSMKKKRSSCSVLLHPSEPWFHRESPKQEQIERQNQDVFAHCQKSRPTTTREAGRTNSWREWYKTCFANRLHAQQAWLKSIYGFSLRNQFPSGVVFSPSIFFNVELIFLFIPWYGSVWNYPNWIFKQCVLVLWWLNLKFDGRDTCGKGWLGCEWNDRDGRRSEEFYNS